MRRAAILVTAGALVVGAGVAIGLTVAPSATSASTIGAIRTVACVSATRCYAIENTGRSGEHTSDILSITPSSWSVSFLGQPGMLLQSLSCTPTGWCVALGAKAMTGIGVSVAEYLDSGTWRAGPTLPGRAPRFTYLACTSSANCMATVDTVGRSSARASFARWNGSSWRVVPGPRLSPYAQLTGIDCVDVTDCMAVGIGVANPTPIAVRWDGHAWKTTKTVPPPKGGGALVGISCPTSRSCLAVGYVALSANQIRSFAERWNGRRWSLLPGPDIPLQSGLFGVSCPEVSACFAVGSSLTSLVGSHLTGAVAQEWGNGRWTDLRPPGETPDPGSPGLNAIDCPSSSSCVAGGFSLKSKIAYVLIDRWDGSKWT